MATRYDSGVSGTLTERGDLDVRAWLARLLLDLEEQPIGSTSTCANPECDRPVDYIGQGHAPHYCCKRCKDRAGEIRRRAAQQLDVITEFLEASRGKHGIPRGELEHRARMLRWWLEQMPQDG